jgi:hypothetical protein
MDYVTAGAFSLKGPGQVAALTPLTASAISLQQTSGSSAFCGLGAQAFALHVGQENPINGFRTKSWIL